MLKIVYYHSNARTNFWGKYLNFVKKARVINSRWYKKIMYVYEKKDSISPTDGVLPGYIYLPPAHTAGMSHHITSLEFSFPNSGHLQNLIIPRDNLLNETTPEVAAATSKEICKLSQELLIKTAIENYIKKLTVRVASKSYFLYYKSNLIEPTLITEINKLISVYCSISYFDEKSFMRL